MFLVSDDYVVEDFDFHQLTGADEVTGHFDVGFGRLRLAARVIVHHDNCARGGDDCRPEHFSRMHEQGIEGADGHQLVAPHSSSRVEHQHDETFTLRVEVRIRRDGRAPVFSGLFWSVTQLHVVRERTFTQCHNLVFLGMERRLNAGS